MRTSSLRSPFLRTTTTTTPQIIFVVIVVIIFFILGELRRGTGGKHRRDWNDNEMERMNGELRDTEKVVRRVKKDDRPLLTGLQIHHNYVRLHMGLHGRTPADLAGIKVD